MTYKHLNAYESTLIDLVRMRAGDLVTITDTGIEAVEGHVLVIKLHRLDYRNRRIKNKTIETRKFNFRDIGPNRHINWLTIYDHEPNEAGEFLDDGKLWLVNNNMDTGGGYDSAFWGYDRRVTRGDDDDRSYQIYFETLEEARKFLADNRELEGRYRVTTYSGCTHEHDPKDGIINQGAADTYEAWQFWVNGTTDMEAGTHRVKLWRIGDKDMPGFALDKNFEPDLRNYIGEFSTPLGKGWQKFKRDDIHGRDYVMPLELEGILQDAADRLKQMAYAALMAMEG